MRVCIRTDASLLIGSGHIMRCLTLADELRSQDVDALFVCREHPGNLCSYIEEKGFTVHRIPCAIVLTEPLKEDAHLSWLGATWQVDAEQTSAVLKSIFPIDWLVVDHYALDSRWEKSLRHLVRRVMVIDDLADREHDCDLILDQNFYKDLESRYDHLVPSGCKKLLGPDYALLRPEFREARKHLKQRDGVVRRILVSFGASDLTDETSKTLHALSMLNRTDIGIDVVVGTANPHKAKVQTLCAGMSNVRFHLQVSNIARLMAEADLFIGAGGSTTWERCFLGLPSIVVSLADNQVELTKHMAAFGALKYLGSNKQITVMSLVSTIKDFLNAPDFLSAMGKKAMSIITSHGEDEGHPLLAIMVKDDITERRLLP